MKEQWEIVRGRARTTVVVWGHQPAFSLRHLTLAQHAANEGRLEVLARARSDREGKLSDAREVAGRFFQRLASLNVRVPAIIGGAVDGQEDLQAQLAKVFEVLPRPQPDQALHRARLVGELWSDFNADQQAQSPPQAPLVVREGETDLGQAEFGELYDDCLAAQKAVGQAAKEVTKAKAALGALVRQVDRDNKRWYRAWTRLFPAGTVEGDAARSNVPTEGRNRLPEPLEFGALTARPDGKVAVTYAEEGGRYAKSLELQWKLDGEAEFAHAAPLERAGQVVGPFAAGMKVALRTRVGTARRKKVFSQAQEVQIPA